MCLKSSDGAASLRCSSIKGLEANEQTSKEDWKARARLKKDCAYIMSECQIWNSMAASVYRNCTNEMDFCLLIGSDQRIWRIVNSISKPFEIPRSNSNQNLTKIRFDSGLKKRGKIYQRIPVPNYKILHNYKFCNINLWRLRITKKSTRN